uniref:DNAation factor, 45 kD, alpha subunit n=1 Tax=Rhipicephalus appendiculatus TaxID=34631 RepID=A0A131YMC6_RHIAP
MTTEDLAGKPHKVWSCDRQTRKCVVASSLDELRTKGAAKLGYNNPFDLKVVLEEDGTEVEDENYFQRAERDTVFLMLQPNEKWLPPGVEALRAGLSFEPKKPSAVHRQGSLKRPSSIILKAHAWNVKISGKRWKLLECEHCDSLDFVFWFLSMCCHVYLAALCCL